ncbi:ATP-binding protein [Loktanella sp. IMCC34160]|uniref:Dph6-related ATP pyrophosphatase n=1 Tax=Loktanella sp. IMCC34160 TaxID=2510646 RepID=UPI00101DF196|nr:ATP-binding protein [Loktanella sp. IMCC34160]RYG93142.1 ATP-binding protein [Loktanella sp. IMCC34160]
MTKPCAIIGWSSGKDCAYALHKVRQEGEIEVVAMLSTTNEAFDRVAMHGTRNALLRAQARAAGLPLIEVPLPFPCSNEEYEARMEAAMDKVKALDVTHMVFGDLFLEDVRDYRIKQLAPTGITPVFPVWGIPTDQLARMIIADGFDARIVTCDPSKMPRDLCGRRYDERFLADLPEGVDPCGENGEFHSAVVAGPIFSAPIPVETGETVERDGFIYTDLIPTNAA